MISIDEFFNKWDDQPLDYDLFTSTKTRFVSGTMFGTISNSHIFKSVVGMISVYMMDKFFRSKFPANIFFHQFSVSRISATPIRVVSNIFFDKFKMTFTRTKNIFTFLMAFIISKYNSAIGTVKNTSTRFVITISTTKSRLIRRWCREFTFTNFTNIFHNYIIYYTMQGVK